MRPVLTFLMSFLFAVVLVQPLEATTETGSKHAEADVETKHTEVDADSKPPNVDSPSKPAATEAATKTSGTAADSSSKTQAASSAAEKSKSEKRNSLMGVVMALNDEGVRLLSNSRFDEAVSFLSRSRTILDDYETARSNLAVALNNKGLHLRHAQLLGLAPMLQSKLYDPINKTTHQNVEGMMRLMSLNPKSFESWKSVIQKLLNNSDYVSVKSAAKEALSIKNDAQLREFIELTPRPLVKTYQPQGAVTTKPGAPYIDSVSAAIKKVWISPPSSKTIKIVLGFELDVAGKPSNLKVIQPGPPEQVQAAKKAVMEARFAAPPKELQSKAPIKIRFTFDRNVHAAPPPDPNKLRPDTSDEHILSMLKDHGLTAEWIRFSMLSAEEHLAKYRFEQASTLLKAAIERLDEPATANDTTVDKQLLQLAVLRRAEAEAGLKNNDEAEQLFKRAIELASATDGNKFYEQEAQQKYGKFLSANAKGDQGEAAFKRSKELFDELMSMIK